MAALEQLCSLPFLLVCSGALRSTIKKDAQLYVQWSGKFQVRISRLQHGCTQAEAAMVGTEWRVAPAIRVIS
uniref:Secreted protein n=1 Tax=Monodon monoceros TaxID=40151 RepID=A0A8C6AHD9_MONMO